SFNYSSHLPTLHSCPTRRSSDLAIQLAKLRGAVVVTTVSGDAKAVHAKRAGADHIINYRTEDVAERVKALTDGRGVNSVIAMDRSEEHTSELQSPDHLVCRLLLE